MELAGLLCTAIAGILALGAAVLLGLTSHRDLGIWVSGASAICIVLAVTCAIQDSAWNQDADAVATREREKREGEIQDRLKALEEGVAQERPRRLTKPQQEAIVRAISTFKPQAIRVLCSLTDSDAGGYAADFATVFREAGWQFGGVTGFVVPSAVENVAVAVNDKLQGNMLPPAGAVALRNVLLELGLAKEGESFYGTAAVAPEEVAVFIAAKPLAEPSANTPPPADESTQSPPPAK